MLFIIYGKCDKIIPRTCDTFASIYPQKQKVFLLNEMLPIGCPLLAIYSSEKSFTVNRLGFHYMETLSEVVK